MSGMFKRMSAMMALAGMLSAPIFPQHQTSARPLPRAQAPAEEFRSLPFQGQARQPATRLSGRQAGT